MHRRPVVAVLSTGNELRDLQDTSSTSTSSPFSGILDSNRPTLISVLRHLHFDVIDLGICGDTMEETKAALKRGKEQADVVVTTGGTSMGVGDLLKPCIERELGGTVHFGRVAMKPGSVFSPSLRGYTCGRSSEPDRTCRIARAGNRRRLRRCRRTRCRRRGSRL